MTKIAIIGGSGLENPDILNQPREIKIETPFGKTSSTFLQGKIGDTDVVLLSRHGRSHSITPTQVNNRANIWAIRELGCTHILATTACGSLREDIGRGDIVIPDQFIDFTKHRVTTFFDSFSDGELKHTPMADPFDATIRNVLTEEAGNLGLKHHSNGTVITIEGPRFSTRAESRLFQSWGGDIINMSVAPECILANEMGIPYAAIALSTDYDCWKTDEAPVTWEEVIKVFRHNINHVINLILQALPKIN